MQATPLIEPSAPPAPTETCGVCGRVIGRLEQPFIWGQSIVCFGCHRDLKDSTVTTESDAANVVAEYCFFNDSKARVTRKRVVFNRAVYRVSQIRFARLHKTAPRRVYAVATALAGLALAVIGLNRHLDRLDLSLLLVGSALFMTGLIVAIVRRPWYFVLITIQETETTAFASKDIKHVTRIVNAIGEAIVERGQLPVARPPARQSRNPSSVSAPRQ
jgi:hypothetical protein